MGIYNQTGYPSQPYMPAGGMGEPQYPPTSSFGGHHYTGPTGATTQYPGSVLPMYDVGGHSHYMNPPSSRAVPR